MIRYYVFLCFAIGILFLGCATTQDTFTENSEGVGNVINEISFPRDFKLIMIPVNLKGKEYRFILDTGATDTVFEISLKDQLGWRLPSREVMAADGKKIKVERFMVRHAHFGGVCKKNIVVLAADLSYASEIAGRRVDGIVGLDILKNYVIQLDFDKNVMLFLRSSNDSEFSGCKADIFLKKKHAYMDAKIENISVHFMIDTGFADSSFMGLLDPEAINYLDAIGNAQGSQACTIAGTMDFNQRKTVIANMQIGNNKYDNAMFVEHHESLLGLYFLSRHIVTFDFPNKKLYLKKIENFDNSSKFSMFISVFDFTVINVNGNVVVESIDPKGLSYKKGLRKSDIILKVNNYDVSAYSLPEFSSILISLLKKKDLNHLKFLIKRNDKLEEINFFDGMEK